MPRYIDADKKLTITVYDEEHEENVDYYMTIEEILDTYTSEGCPLTADVVENKVLRLLLDWAIECGFGYDSIPEEYEKYKDDIQDMNYADGLIYIAMKEVKNEQIH